VRLDYQERDSYSEQGQSWLVVSLSVTQGACQRGQHPFNAVPLRSLFDLHANGDEEELNAED
jgi:hypothetical protein